MIEGYLTSISLKRIDNQLLQGSWNDSIDMLSTSRMSGYAQNLLRYNVVLEAFSTPQHPQEPQLVLLVLSFGINDINFKAW
jgi:hypothetical protein